MLIVTTDTIASKQITDVYGLCKGTSVRAKGFGSDFGAGLKNLVGGEIKAYTKLQDESRKIAVQRLIEDAMRLNPNANAILGFKITSSQIAQGASEITVYGTAVRIEE